MLSETKTTPVHQGQRNNGKAKQYDERDAVKAFGHASLLRTINSPTMMSW